MKNVAVELLCYLLYESMQGLSVYNVIIIFCYNHVDMSLIPAAEFLCDCDYLKWRYIATCNGTMHYIVRGMVT